MRHTLLLLVFLLSACDQSGFRPPVTDRLPEAARIDNWRGGDATVGARFHGEGGAAEVASGTVNAAGGLEFTLKPVARAQLTGFVACPDVTVSDTALKLNAFSALNVVDGGVRSGQVALVSGPSVAGEGLKRVGDYYLQYTYADRAAQISGGCAIGGAPGTFNYALELKPGWNTVVFKLTSSDTLRLSTAPVPADAAWFFSEVTP